MTTNTFYISNLILALFLSVNGFGQINVDYKGDCYKIEFQKKGLNVSDSAIIPVYQSHGFEIIENGVYDLIIDGKKYFQSLIFKIESNNFSISVNWYFENGTVITPDTLIFSSNQDLKIRMLTVENGRGGLPFKVGSKKYDITFKKEDAFCQMRYAKVDNSSVPNACYYFTGYSWKIIRMKEGKPYFVGKAGEFVLRRK